MKSVTDILRDLVAIPSVSSDSNEPVVRYAQRCLETGRWQVRLYPYRDPAGTLKLNLVAVTKPQTSAELALVCHTDTVPFDPAWDEAVHPVVRDGRLYGRGSCDVKGFLACILSAVAGLDLDQLSRPLGIVLTADEEVGCIGAKYLARNQSIQARYAIVGEPTGLQPVRAGKGYALAEIVVRGKEAHSAFPQRGRSAISDAARVVIALEQVAENLASQTVLGFDPPCTTLNVGLIQGGTAKNIVPGECRITVEWRPVPGQDPHLTSRLIERETERLGIDATLEVKRVDPGFAPGEMATLAPFLESLTGRKSTTVAFGTEAPHLGASSVETVVFGPGDMITAHRTGESVAIAELDQCVEYLRATIQRFCGS